MPPPQPPKLRNDDKQPTLSGKCARENGPPLPALPGKSIYKNFNYNHQNNLSQDGPNLTQFSSRANVSQPISLQSSKESHDKPNSTLALADQAYQPARLSNDDLNSSPRQNEISSHSQNVLYSQYQPQLQLSKIRRNSYSQTRPKTPLDLLSAPLFLTGTPDSNQGSLGLPAPPVPPNPEKDLLLQKIGHVLYSERQKAISQMESSLPDLQSQYNAMLASLRKMEVELLELESLNDVLASNSKIINTALQNADSVILSSQNRELPSIDELLIAPSVVANQLYETVSEERSLGDTLFVLGRAVEKGRIDGITFAKMTRSLSREWYLKKALVRKIGHGMGLITK